jgi:peptidoglycan/LPS O-acetylase OafA/YrhL
MSSTIPKLLYTYGWLGVDIFFVISEFVIPLSLFGKGYTLRNFPNFMLRRLIRLEPPYLISIILVITLWHLSAIMPGFRGFDPSYSFQQIAFHLFYAIPLTDYEWLSPVYWSLAYEFVFYIIVGLTFANLISQDVNLTVFIAAVVAGVSFYLQSRIDVRILEFLVGVLLMRWVVHGDDRLKIGRWIAVCLAFVFFVGGFATSIAVSLPVVAILCFRQLQFGRAAYFFGGISYSLYLTHVTIGGRVINFGKRFGDGAVYEILLVALALFISVLFATLFARFIEGPATRASRMITLQPTLENI